MLTKTALRAALKMQHIGNEKIGIFVRHCTLQRALLLGKIDGMRSGGGRPGTTWMANVIEWSGCGCVEATRKARDRNY